MQKTTNYQLNQWEPSDPIRREDFNADNAAIDAAIRSAVDAAGAAQKAAEGAQKAAETMYVIGSYIGDGKKLSEGGQLIELGFRPRFVIISRGWPTSSMSTTFLAVGEYMTDEVDLLFNFHDSGFVVGNYDSNHLRLNFENLPFSYIAFR